LLKLLLTCITTFNVRQNFLTQRWGSDTWKNIVIHFGKNTTILSYRTLFEHERKLNLKVKAFEEILKCMLSAEK